MSVLCRGRGMRDHKNKKIDNCFYSIMDGTPVGDIILFGSANGLCRLEMAVKSFDKAIDNFARQGNFPVKSTKDELRDIVRQLNEYFLKKRKSFSVKLDLTEVTPFRRRVYDILPKEAAYGDTISYGGLALKLGGLKYSRAVGSAMANNPIPIIIPCHRVLKSDRSLGGFGGGLDLKVKLLEIEGTEISQSNRK